MFSKIPEGESIPDFPEKLGQLKLLIFKVILFICIFNTHLFIQNSCYFTYISNAYLFIYVYFIPLKLVTGSGTFIHE